MSFPQDLFTMDPRNKRRIACVRATRPHAVFSLRILQRTAVRPTTPWNHVYVAIVPHLTAKVKAVCITKGRALQMKIEGSPTSSGPVRLSKMHPVRNSLHTNGWQR